MGLARLFAKQARCQCIGEFSLADARLSREQQGVRKLDMRARQAFP